METINDVSRTEKKLISGTVTYNVNIYESRLQWSGEKPAKYGHTGTVNIKSGELYFEKEKLTGGKIEVDLRSIKVINLEAKSSNKLIGHLMSSDFFDVAKYPTATFVVITAEKKQEDSYEITGDICVRGVTKSISFPAKIVTADKNLSAEAEFRVNRVDFGANYGSVSLGTEPGEVISDHVDIKAEIKAKVEE